MHFVQVQSDDNFCMYTLCKFSQMSVYDKVAKNAEARKQISKCEKSLDIEEEVIEELFEFTRLVIYGDKVSRTMGTARAAKWKAMKKNSPPTRCG